MGYFSKTETARLLKVPNKGPTLMGEVEGRQWVTTTRIALDAVLCTDLPDDTANAYLYAKGVWEKVADLDAPNLTGVINHHSKRADHIGGAVVTGDILETHATYNGRTGKVDVDRVALRFHRGGDAIVGWVNPQHLPLLAIPHTTLHKGEKTSDAIVVRRDADDAVLALVMCIRGN